MSAESVIIISIINLTFIHLKNDTHAQILGEHFGGTEKEDLQIQQLFQGYIGVAALPAVHQANFLQPHPRDDALRFYQTLPAAIRANVPISLETLRDQFCNLQLQEVHVLTLEQHDTNQKQIRLKTSW